MPLIVKSQMPPHAHFFTQQPLTAGVFDWLFFSESLNRAAAPIPLHPQPILHPQAILAQWLAMQPVYGHQKQGLRLALTGTLLLAGVLGGGSMLGALTYSGASPVKLWLMIGLFCFLPLALTFSGALMSTRSAHTPFLAEFFARLLAKYIGAKSAAPKLPPLLVRVSGRAWLIWWLQLAGLVAQLAALVTFVMVLLFNDVAFGWASTIIEQSQGLHSFFAIFIQKLKFYIGFLCF